jgi:hypothetical protein
MSMMETMNMRVRVRIVKPARRPVARHSGIVKQFRLAQRSKGEAALHNDNGKPQQCFAR